MKILKNARRRYYSKALDKYTAGGSVGTNPIDQSHHGEFYNLISSKRDDGTHSPLLDVDIPCKYTKSSTKGHGHLSFPSLNLSWAEYEDLMLALVRAGIIEEAYFAHARTRQMTLVRPPHIRKATPDRPAKPWPDGAAFAPSVEQMRRLKRSSMSVGSL